MIAGTGKMVVDVVKLICDRNMKRTSVTKVHS